MSSPARILVVDDEAAIADLVARVLSDEGFEVEAFQSAPDALTAFHNGAFDLAILDVMMPQMDGFELCAKLRATSNIPILFLSAKAEENDHRFVPVSSSPASALDYGGHLRFRCQTVRMNCAAAI